MFKVKKFQKLFFSKSFGYNNFSVGGGGFHLPPAQIGLIQLEFEALLQKLQS